MIVRTCRIDGNQRYSWIKSRRSLFVSRTRPCSLRLKTINCCRLDQQYCLAAMSAARRLAEIEPATLPGVLAILSYVVDEGEQNQDFPWSEVGTANYEL